MNKPDFRNNHPEDIDGLFRSNGFSDQKIKNFFKAFRTQDISFIGELKGIRDISRITGLLPYSPLKIYDIIKDDEGNEKFIFETIDGHKIESIYMPGKKNSICVSTQAGCRMKCAFCKTGLGGLKRNLKASEILDQARIIHLSRMMPGKIECVTFMGMGEPMDNPDECHIAFKWLNSDRGYQVSREKITFSTIVTKQFDSFLEWEKLPNLAVSLHSVIQMTRKKLIPSSFYEIEGIKIKAREYIVKTGKQVTIEYCLMNDVNDSDEDAERLSEYLKDLKCKVNLLNYNVIDGLEYRPVSIGRLMEFKDILKKNKIPVVYRKSLGTAIKAGCGQLG